MRKATTLYWDETGPLMKYHYGVLYIDDLNPQVAIKWRMSRWEMVVFGLKCIWAAALWG